MFPVTRSEFLELCSTLEGFFFLFKYLGIRRRKQRKKQELNNIITKTKAKQKPTKIKKNYSCWVNDN